MSMFYIKDAITRLKTLRGQIKETTKEEDLDIFKMKFNAVAYDLQLAVGEANFTLDNAIYIDRMYQNNNGFILAAQGSESIDEFMRAVDDILAQFEDYDYEVYFLDDLKTPALDLMSNVRERSLDNYFSLESVLKSSIDVAPKREISLFYPDCSSGFAMTAFDAIDHEIISYGSEANDYRLSDAKQVMTKVVKGSLKGSRIQNNAFDILYCQPQIKYDMDKYDKFYLKRTEKTYISEMFKYLRNDGVMIIAMPYFRLYKDMCSMLSKQLKNISLFEANPIDYSNAGMIYIIGQKDPSKEIRQEEYEKLREIYDYRKIKRYHDLDTVKYTLPRSKIYIDLFKGSALDLEEAQYIVDNSPLLERVFNSQRVRKNDENIKNPLLPFNIGQIGLVLTSGCLDGVVDEGDGHKHLIKGRVTKYTTETEISNSSSVEITETIVNKVEISVLMPDGNFKVFA